MEICGNGRMVWGQRGMLGLSGGWGSCWGWWMMRTRKTVQLDEATKIKANEIGIGLVGFTAGIRHFDFYLSTAESFVDN